tara:strand:+ start:1089 stop:1613 length:525 start_codon:yes stop_codon:yes gene_type:complete
VKSTVTKSKTSKVLSLWDYDLENMTPKDVLTKACSDAINQSIQPLPIYIRRLVDPFYLKTIVDLIHGKRSGSIVYLDFKTNSDQPSFVRRFYGNNDILTKEVEQSLNGTLVLIDVDKLNPELQSAMRGILSQFERDRLPIKLVSIGSTDLESMIAKASFDLGLYFRLVASVIVI